MKQLLIIAFSDLENDPRVYRQIKHLSQYYKVSTIGWEPAGIEGVEFFPILPIQRSRVNRLERAFLYKLGCYERLYWSLYEFEPLFQQLKGLHFDLIIANDIDTLPFGLKLAGRAGSKVLFDAHEYAPGQFEDRWQWRFFFQDFNRYLCKRYMPQCDYITTVSPGLAGRYHREYGTEIGVITNATEYYDLSPTPVQDDRVRMITHGVGNPNRRLELMIKAMDRLDSRFSLDLMLLPTYPRYYEKLKQMAAQRDNVGIVPPVSREEIVPSIHGYDLSFLLFKPYTVNFKLGIFNKFFESLQARLGIVSGPSPDDHARLIRQHQCGVVTKSFDLDDFAKTLNGLTVKQIREFKENAGDGAKELNARNNMDVLGRIVQGLLT